MRLAQAVQAHPENIGRRFERKRAVRGDAHAEKQFPGFPDDIAEVARAIAPQKRLAPFDDENPHAPGIQGLHAGDGLFERKRRAFLLPERTVPASEITGVGQLQTAEQRLFVPNPALQRIGDKVRVLAKLREDAQFLVL